jgi:predicted enzyme related to lactoylglutathione lyase
MAEVQAEPVTVRLYRVIVPVADMEKAVRFYGALFDQPGERVADTRHYFDCGGVVLACVDPAGSAAHAPGNGVPESAEFRPNPDHVYFAVKNLDAMLERAREAGAHIRSEIRSYPWGERSFYMHDPFGNPLCFVDERTLFLGGRFVD